MPAARREGGYGGLGDPDARRPESERREREDLYRANFGDHRYPGQQLYQPYRPPAAPVCPPLPTEDTQPLRRNASFGRVFRSLDVGDEEHNPRSPRSLQSSTTPYSRRRSVSSDTLGFPGSPSFERHQPAQRRDELLSVAARREREESGELERTASAMSRWSSGSGRRREPDEGEGGRGFSPPPHLERRRTSISQAGLGEYDPSESGTDSSHSSDGHKFRYDRRSQVEARERGERMGHTAVSPPLLQHSTHGSLERAASFRHADQDEPEPDRYDSREGSPERPGESQHDRDRRHSLEMRESYPLFPDAPGHRIPREQEPKHHGFDFGLDPGSPYHESRWVRPPSSYRREGEHEHVGVAVSSGEEDEREREREDEEREKQEKQQRRKKGKTKRKSRNYFPDAHLVGGSEEQARLRRRQDTSDKKRWAKEKKELRPFYKLWPFWVMMAVAVGVIIVVILYFTVLKKQ
ncbi:hypothetical protein JCM8547_006103 [Rhodosporidiobolus lusitaniae]